MESATVTLGHGHAEDEHHGPPEANQSSRIDRQTLGILLFIVSEVMLFGAFFASYFFLRVVVNPPSWPPRPVRAAGPGRRLNTGDPGLLELHDPLRPGGDPPRQPPGHETRPRAHLAARRRPSSSSSSTSTSHLGFSARDLAFGSIFYSLTGLHGAHVFVGLMLLSFATIRAFRGHFGPEEKDHLGVEVPGIYWHFVDVMWIIVFLTVYVL